MNCTGFEERIALYVEGDLPEVERHSVESHLGTCAQCRELAADLRDSQLVFKAVRQELPHSSALRAVRERVLAEVAGSDPRSWWERIFFAGFPRKTAVAATALLALGSTALWFASRVDLPHDETPVVVQAVQTPPTVVTSSSENLSSVPAPNNVAPSPRKVRRPASNRVATAVDSSAAGLPRAQGSEESPPAQIAVKLLTDDPNVIIYWLIDAKGD